MNEVTIPTVSPQVNVPKLRHQFAHRQFIKVMAVICEKCGRTTTGRGVTRWKCCPRCGAFVISSKEQRQRSSWYGTHIYDERIYQRHQLSEVVEDPK